MVPGGNDVGLHFGGTRPRRWESCPAQVRTYTERRGLLVTPSGDNNKIKLITETLHT